MESKHCRFAQQMTPQYRDPMASSSGWPSRRSPDPSSQPFTPRGPTENCGCWNTWTMKMWVDPNLFSFIIISLLRLLVFWTCLPLNVLWMNSLMCTWWPTSWGLTSTTSSGLRGETIYDVDNLTSNLSYRLSDDHVQFLVYQIVRGMKYVHSAGIIHRWDGTLALWQRNYNLMQFTIWIILTLLKSKSLFYSQQISVQGPEAL